MSHVRHYRVLPWATEQLTLLESIAKVPDRQVAKLGKSSISSDILLSFVHHDSTITAEAITTIHTTSTEPFKITLPYSHPLNEHSTQHCSHHSLPHKRQFISATSSSNKISQHNLHCNMAIHTQHAHALDSFYICTGQTISAMLSSNYIAANSVSIHILKKTTHPDCPPSPLPSTTLLCTPLNTKHKAWLAKWHKM